MMDDPELLAVVEASTSLHRRHERRTRVRTAWLSAISALAGVVACVTIGSSLLHRNDAPGQSAQILDLGFTRGSSFEQHLEIRPGVEALVVRIDVGIPEEERYGLALRSADSNRELWAAEHAVDSDGYVIVTLPTALLESGRYRFHVADDLGELGSLLVSVRVSQ